jgi:hypothetical protein
MERCEQLLRVSQEKREQREGERDKDVCLFRERERFLSEELAKIQRSIHVEKQAWLQEVTQHS